MMSWQKANLRMDGWCYDVMLSVNTSWEGATYSQRNLMTHNTNMPQYAGACVWFRNTNTLNKCQRKFCSQPLPLICVVLWISGDIWRKGVVFEQISVSSSFSLNPPTRVSVTPPSLHLNLNPVLFQSPSWFSISHSALRINNGSCHSPCAQDCWKLLQLLNKLGRALFLRSRLLLESDIWVRAATLCNYHDYNGMSWE